MTTQFASGRSSLLSPAVYITGSGGIQGGNQQYYFWLQGRSRGGYNNVSAPFNLVVPNNCSLGVVIPGISYLPSEDWHEFLVYTSTTNDFTTARLIGVYNALQSNQVTKTQLGSNTPLESDPKQLTLTLDNQINFSSTVANPAGLPATPINGVRRYIQTLGRTYRYSASSTATIDGLKVLTATTGRWLLSASNNLIENPVSLTTSINGCNQNINLANENPDLIYAVYDVSGNAGTPIRYYIKSASNTTVPKGTRIVLAVRVDNKDVTDDFSGLLDVTIEGKVNTTNYSLATIDMQSAGSIVTYDHFARNILLETDLNPDEYLLLSVTPRFALTDTDITIAPSTGLSLYPYFDSNRSSYNESNLAVGDLIFATENKRLIVPYGLGLLRGLEGSGCINLYTFRNASTQDITVSTSNTAGQSVCIARTGDLIVGTPNTVRPRRALFSTLARNTRISEWSIATTITTGQTIQYTLTIENNIVSTLYSDPALRGTAGLLNTNKVQIIVKIGSVYKGFIITVDPVQSVISGTISDWSAGVLLDINEINNRTEGLFRCITTTHTVNGSGGNTPSGAIQVAYSYVYDGTNVSDISHSVSDGCITTEYTQYKDTYNRSQFWAEPVLDLDGLKSLAYPARIDQQVRSCISNGLLYSYKINSTAIPDNTSIIQPNDYKGRWLVQQNTQSQYTEIIPISSASNLSVSLANGNPDFVLTQNTSITFTNFSNGGYWRIFFQQGGTGNYTATFNNVNFGLQNPPVLSTAVGTIDIVTIMSRGGLLYGTITKGFATLNPDPVTGEWRNITDDQFRTLTDDQWRTLNGG